MRRRHLNGIVRAAEQGNANAQCKHRIDVSKWVARV